MLRTNSILFGIILLTIFGTILSPIYIGFLDEFIALLIIVAAVLDMVINGTFKDYKLLWIMVAILMFYACYSIFSLDYNTTGAILYDLVLQLKPLIPLAVCYVVAPRFTPFQKEVTKWICMGLGAFSLLVFATGMNDYVFGHVATFGNTVFCLFAFYLLCSIDDEGNISRKDVYLSLVLLATGLICTRSKYYGEFLFALFMLIAYKPGMFKELKPAYIFALCAMLVITLVVVWPKLEYYFLQNIGEEISTDEVMTMARMALYYGMTQILTDMPLLGSGLASFAVFASSPDVNYSSLYAEYNLDKVWGLSEAMPDFICDAYYPQLAQFGYIGIVLFIVLWCFVYQRLRLLMRQGRKAEFVLGMMCMAFILIESTTGTTFMKAYGEAVMIILGILIAPTRTMTRDEKRAILNNHISKKR